MRFLALTSPLDREPVLPCYLARYRCSVQKRWDGKAIGWLSKRGIVSVIDTMRTKGDHNSIRRSTPLLGIERAPPNVRSNGRATFVALP